MAEGIGIPWDGGDVIADKRARKKLESAKKIRARSISTVTDHAFKILGEYSHNQPVCHLRESIGMRQLTMTSHGNLGLPHTTTMDIQPPQTQLASWNLIVDAGAICLPPSSASNPFNNGGPGANGVLPYVIAATALLALARQAKGVEQRNPRKQSPMCQSSKTRATRTVGNQDSKEQIPRKPRKCNALMSKVIQTASEDDSTQDISLGSDQAAQHQSTVTWVINAA